MHEGNDMSIMITLKKPTPERELPQGCGSDCHRPHAWAVAIKSATASGVSFVTVCSVDTGRVTRRGRRN